MCIPRSIINRTSKLVPERCIPSTIKGLVLRITFSEHSELYITIHYPSTHPKESSQHIDITYNLPEKVRFSKATIKDHEIDNGLFHVIFSPNGSTTGGEITLVSKSGRKMCIQIDAITGMVKLLAHDQLDK